MRLTTGRNLKAYLAMGSSDGSMLGRQQARENVALETSMSQSFILYKGV